MNIRSHVLAHIRAGGNAKLEAANYATDGGFVSGVRFYGPDEPASGTFIPFARLGYNQELGYFGMDGTGDDESECSNDNPFTVHRLENRDPDDDWEAYALLDDGGYGFLLGERYQMADALAAIRDALAGFLSVDIPDDAPELGVKWLSTSEAVEECYLHKPLDFPLKGGNTAQRLRAAAREDRIRAMKDGDRWLFEAMSLRRWILDETAHKPGPKPAD